MSVAFRHSGSGYIPPADLKKADKLLLQDVTVDHDHDIPFCAGVSHDGKTLYVDHAVPEKINGMDLMKPLVVHELVEHCLMRMCGLPYDEAHYIATAAEEACARAHGYDKSKYDGAWDKIIRNVGSRGSYPNVPDDLDTEPYKTDPEVEKKMDHGLFGKEE